MKVKYEIIKWIDDTYSIRRTKTSRYLLFFTSVEIAYKSISLHRTWWSEDGEVGDFCKTSSRSTITKLFQNLIDKGKTLDSKEI